MLRLETMKLLLAFAGSVVAMFIVLTSCEQGPSGVHPSVELQTEARRGEPYNDTIFVNYTAFGITSGDSLPMRSFLFERSTLDGVAQTRMEGSVYDLVPDNEDPIDADYVLVSFPYVVSEPTTISNWQVGTITIRNDRPAAAMTVGPRIRLNMIEYFGVSGSIVITDVEKSGSRVKSIEGYINGKFRTIWPIGFRQSNNGELPAGFDATNPSLIGNELTLHSVRFRMSSLIGIPFATSGN